MFSDLVTKVLRLIAIIIISYNGIISMDFDLVKRQPWLCRPRTLGPVQSIKTLSVARYSSLLDSSKMADVSRLRGSELACLRLSDCPRSDCCHGLFAAPRAGLYEFHALWIATGKGSLGRRRSNLQSGYSRICPYTPRSVDRCPPSFFKLPRED